MSSNDRRKKLKHKKKLKGYDIAPVPRRAKQGRNRMREIQTESLAEIPAIVARARAVGTKDLPAMRSQALEGPPGQALRLFVGSHYPDDPDAAHGRLYEAFMGYCKSQDRANGILRSTSLHAKCAKIETMPEVFEVRADYTPEDRTEEEIIDATREAEIKWTRRLNALPMRPRSLIQSAHIGWVQLIEDSQLTRDGVDFCLACEMLADVVDGG